MAILDVHPVYVWIDDNGCVEVALRGGLYHCGVIAYPKGYRRRADDSANKELIPGLWYYDDGYQENPEYEDYIQSLRPKTVLP